MSTVLQVENINVYYGSIHAVKDVSLALFLCFLRCPFPLINI